MDDLRRIRELYGEPEESPGARDRVMARLEAAPGRRRPRWTPLLASLAVAAVAAVAFAVPGMRADQGSDVLRAAASVTERQPATKGAYWHIKRVINGTEVTELWVARDGRAWVATRPKHGEPGAGEGKPVPFTGKGPFTMFGHELTLAQIEALPRDPDTLRDEVERIVRDVPEKDRDGVVADALSGLLWSKPAPPDVRAAAYRALAGLPGVRYLGNWTFSYEVRGEKRELTVSQADGQVIKAITGAMTEVVLEAEWTDEKP